MSSDENASFMALVSSRSLLRGSRGCLGRSMLARVRARSARIYIGNMGDKVLVIGEVPILEGESLAPGKDEVLNCRQGNVVKMDGNSRSHLRGHCINRFIDIDEPVGDCVDIDRL